MWFDRGFGVFAIALGLFLLFIVIPGTQPPMPPALIELLTGVALAVVIVGLAMIFGAGADEE